MGQLFKSDPKLREHKGYWSVRFYDPETRRRKEHSLGTKSKEVALRRYRQMAVAYERGEFDPFQDKYQFEALRLTEAIEEFLSFKEGRVREATLEDYEKFLNTLQKNVPRDLLLSEYTEADARELINQPPSPHTQEGYYRRLRVFFRWCIKEDLTDRNPLENIEKPSPARKTPAFLSRDEFDALIEAVRSDYAEKEDDMYRDGLVTWLIDVFKFAVATGLRRREIAHLRRRDVDLENGFVYVRAYGDYSPKSNRDRTIPLFPMARKAALSHLEDRAEESRDSLLFIGYGGEMLNGGYLSHRFLYYRRVAGLSEDYSFHTLRHTFASWLRMEGIPLDRIRDWMGHASITQTEVYAHITPESIREEGRDVFPA